jgi:hypothetical protein
VPEIDPVTDCATAAAASIPTSSTTANIPNSNLEKRHLELNMAGLLQVILRIPVLLVSDD